MSKDSIFHAKLKNKLLLLWEKADPSISELVSNRVFVTFEWYFAVSVVSLFKWHSKEKNILRAMQVTGMMTGPLLKVHWGFTTHSKRQGSWRQVLKKMVNKDSKNFSINAFPWLLGQWL